MLSDPMVVARHERRKTQTRRLITLQDSNIDGSGRRVPYRLDGATWADFDFGAAFVDGGPSPAGNAGPYLKAPLTWGGVRNHTTHRLYPIYQPGDLIWWRECHQYVNDKGDAVQYRTGKDVRYFPQDAFGTVRGDQFWRWRPSIHMPRWAARYVDTVVACRPERLSQVTDADAMAEGVVRDMIYPRWHVPGLPVSDKDSPRGCYLKLMQHLHGDGIVEEDPWVWVITYRFGE